MRPGYFLIDLRQKNSPASAASTRPPSDERHPGAYPLKWPGI
ncbi:MAG: hypothetical protein AAB658_09485 [Chloroflexota bacterium]